MARYFTSAEAAVLRASEWANETIAYEDVSRSQFSIARHYGGARVGQHFFVYIPATDELIRQDVMTFLRVLRSRMKAPRRKAYSAKASEAQTSLGF